MCDVTNNAIIKLLLIHYSLARFNIVNLQIETALKSIKFSITISYIYKLTYFKLAVQLSGQN